MEGQWLFGGVEHDDSSKCFLVTVADRTANTLLPLIQQNIRPQSVIMSDMWKPYNGIAKLPENYKHLTVNHSVEYKNKENGACTNTVEGTWRHVKRSLPLATKKDKYDSYLGEFLWRKKNKGLDLFQCILNDVSMLFPPVNHE